MRITHGVLSAVLLGSMAAVTQAQSSVPEVEKKLKSFFSKDDRIGVMLYLIDNEPFFYGHASKKGLAAYLDGQIDYKTFASKFQSKFAALDALGKATGGGKLVPAPYSIAGIEKNGWFDTPFKRAVVAGVGQLIKGRELLSEPGFWAGLASIGWGAVPYVAMATGVVGVHQIMNRQAEGRDVFLSAGSYLVPGIALNLVNLLGSSSPPILIIKVGLTYFLGGWIEKRLLEKAGSGKPKVGLVHQFDRIWGSGEKK